MDSEYLGRLFKLINAMFFIHIQDTMPGERIAVIGAGVSGLSAIKVCLEEGLEPICFEGSSDIGGMWRYNDYPFSDHFPNYLHNSKIMEYLQMYVKPFHLLKHIRFLDSEMLSSRLKGSRNPMSLMGLWCVVALKPIPSCHSITFQVFLSTRHGAWIWNWVWDYGMPMDIVLFTHFNSVVNQVYHTFLINRWAENKLNARFNHDIYGLLPQHRFLNNPCDTRRVQCKDYVDEIASEIGVKPNLFSLFPWDPKLALEIFFGSCTPYQYHLQGPGKWAGARGAILTQREQIIKPVRTRILTGDQAPYSVPFWLKSVCVALLLFVLTLVIIKG
eukprot:bmy_22032T0